MRIDIPIRLVFAVEIFEDEEKGKVLEHIGMVAGMEGVAVAEHDRAAEIKNPIIPQTIAITAFRRPLCQENATISALSYHGKKTSCLQASVQGMGKITDIAQPLRPTFVPTLSSCPPEIADNLQTGASVANNGCCLTITRIDGNKVSFDLVDETLRKTNLGSLKVGDSVNLERAARFGDEIGGHVMSGHVMAVTRISRIESSEFNRTVWFELPENLKPYILTKGFVGLDAAA